MSLLDEIRKKNNSSFWYLICYASRWRDRAKHQDCETDCSCSDKIKEFDLSKSFEDYLIKIQEYKSLPVGWLEIRTNSPRNMAYHKALIAYEQAMKLHMSRAVVLGSLDCSLLQSNIREAREAIYL